MYKPANIREFVTPAVHKKATSKTVENRTVKTYTEVGTVRGKFKQKGTAETTANGLTIINEKTTFITWFKADFAAADILTINGVDFEIIGTPENVEMRNRYAVLTLERISGGA
jgi:hypothetical protein